MINDYLKQLESAIVPRQYNSEYFKQGGTLNSDEKKAYFSSELNNKAISSNNNKNHLVT